MNDIPGVIPGNTFLLYLYFYYEKIAKSHPLGGDNMNTADKIVIIKPDMNKGLYGYITKMINSNFPKNNESSKIIPTVLGHKP